LLQNILYNASHRGSPYRSLIYPRHCFDNNEHEDALNFVKASDQASSGMASARQLYAAGMLVYEKIEITFAKFKVFKLSFFLKRGVGWAQIQKMIVLQRT